jgi:class 3 adenylate cyclase
MHDAHSLAPPSERLSARWLHRRLITIYTIAGTMAVAIGTVLCLFGLDLTPRQIPILAGVSALACIPMLLSDVLVISIHFRPIGAFLRALPGRAAAASAAAALVQALNLPVLTALRVLLVHAPSFAVGFTLLALGANHYLGLDLQVPQFFIAWLAIIFVATGHAILEYFAVAVAIRPVVRLIWSHCGELAPEQRRRIIPVGLRRKLFFVSAFVVFFPLLVLGFTVLVKVNALLVSLGVEDIAPLTVPLRTWVILLVGGSTVAMLFMAVAMARETTYSVDEMMRAFRRVEGEELDTHLTVTSTDEFAVLYEGFNRMTSGLRERERLRHAFGCYVAPELAEEVMRHGVSLGGETVSASVLFADIRDFTALSEQMTPTEVVSLLNRYFAAVGSAIEAEGGWINKFGGDSLLAVFGAPVPQADHARRAVRAALGMRGALAEFNARQQEAGSPALRIGIGIDCGDMVAGSVGSPERMEYTVIGDVVNVASRIDGLNKAWGTDVLISAGVYAAAGVDVPTKAMPPAEVQGKSEPIQVYALE